MMTSMVAATLRKPNGQFAKTRTELWTTETWDDGWIDRKGKFHVYRPDYPNSTDAGWAFRYHIVWWLATGQIIKHPQALHHINHNGLDDRFGNLQLMQAGEHTSHHSRKPITKNCLECGGEFTHPKWRSETRKFCSLDCYHKYPRSLQHRENISKGLVLAYEARQI